MKLIIYLTLMLLTIGTIAVQAIPQSELQAAIKAELEGKPFCGNQVCQDGEKTTCPQDCPFDVGNMSCIVDGSDCSLSSIMIYVTLAVILVRVYTNQTKKKKNGK